MTEQLIAMALRFRAAVVGGTLLLIGAGAWSLATINLDAFPDLTPNQVEVLTAAPGEDPFAGFVRQIEGWMKVNTTEN